MSGRRGGETADRLQCQRRVAKGSGSGDITADLSAINFNSGLSSPASQRACKKSKEPHSYQANASATASLDEGSVQCNLAMQTAFSTGNEVISNARSEQMLDAQVPDMDMDSRRGSPCQQAAADFMDPVGVDFPAGRANSMSSLGLKSTISQTLAEGFLPPDAVPPTSQSPAPPPKQGDVETSADEQSAPIPGLAQQPDWFNAMMEQAQSVGLWGGIRAEQKPGRAPSPPSGLPILPHHLLTRAASGVQEKPTEEKVVNPLAIYEMGMASLLPSKPCSRGPSAGPESLTPPDTAAMPRLQPVSLGMTSSQPQAAPMALPLREPFFRQPNDGPFRPPTRPRELPVAPQTLGTEMLHPMLHQSKLQISLGLAADTPLDLKSWGYGGDALEEHRRRQEAADSGDAKALSAPAAAGTHLLGAPSIRQAASDCANHDSLPVSPIGGQQPSFRAASLSTGMPSTSANTFSSIRDAQTTDHRSTSMSTGHDDSSTRAESLERYREKKRRRLFSKTIRYHKRKVNADKRPRIKGRFVKASEADASGQGDEEGLALASEGHDEVDMA